MLRPAFLLLLASAVIPSHAQDQPRFEPAWDSLNARETPAWFNDAKFGVFIHWGVYSVPAFSDTSTYSEWYQHWLDTNSHDGLVRDFHNRWYGEQFEYREFAPMFRAEFFDAGEWADIIERSGARYMVLTSKHHDGFCLWDSDVASEVRGYAWNSVETGPNRDLVGELLTACREKGVRPGLYYSFMEWHNPLYDTDKPAYVDRVMIPQIKELITTYQPDVFWPDGEWNHPDTTWRSPEVLEWIYENAPNSEEIVVNDRWGKGLRGRVGDYSTTEYGSLGNSSGKGMRREKPFEECRGIGGSFAFNRAEGYDAYASRTECVQLLVDLVSKGGGLLLNIGPTADGRIPPIMTDRLLAIGRWLDVNGEAIYGCDAGPYQDVAWGRTTRKGDNIYLHVFEWPSNDKLVIEGFKTRVSSATMLSDRVEHRELRRILAEDGTLTVSLAGLHPFEHVTVIKLKTVE